MTNDVRETLIVEGPLDAIACTEQGHPALALGTTSPSEALVKRIRREAESGKARFFLALDGTADVTQAWRCNVAAAFGPFMRVCVLVNGQDPDELPASDLAALKAEARAVVDEWFTLLESVAGDVEKTTLARKQFGALLAEWETAFPASAGERATAVQAALNLTPENYRAWLGQHTHKISDAGGQRKWIPDPDYPWQPAMPAFSTGDGKRPVISNFKLKKETNTDGDGDTSTSTRFEALPIEAIAVQVCEALNGYPFRFGSAGEMMPTLFLPDGRGKIRPLHSSNALQTLLHQHAELKFRTKQDSRGVNFVSFENLFLYFAGAVDVPQFEGVFYRAHEPPIQGLFYTWRKPTDYVPDGSYLCAAVAAFDNIKCPMQRYVFAAALCTPCWGGPCGKRPILIFAGDQPGSGKGLASELVGYVSGGELIELDAGKKAEDTLKERILSGDSRHKTVIRMDNVKGSINSALIESTITAPAISGKALYKGEATRPNIFTWLVTANDVRVSPDIARRGFFMKLDKPTISFEWDEKYAWLIANQERLALDCLHVLKQALPEVDINGCGETFGHWTRDVLARVMAFGPLQELIGETFDVKAILTGNGVLRAQADEAIGEAGEFEQALIRWVAFQEQFWRREAVDAAVTYVVTKPTANVRVDVDDVAKCWNHTFGGKPKSKPWIGRLVTGHVKAGRITCLTPRRSGSGMDYEIRADAFTSYLEAVEQGRVVPTEIPENVK